MTFSLLDTVVFVHDVPQHGLRGGDVGAVVEVYENGTLEVEFVRPSGGTQALVTLTPEAHLACARSSLPYSASMHSW